MAIQHKYIVGNWKMNHSKKSIREFFEQLTTPAHPNIQRWIAAQALHLDLCQGLAPQDVKIGAQNSSWEKNGAFTGEISADALFEAGHHFVILGHSERRTIFHESDATISKKLQVALASGLHVILCVGETLEEQGAGQTEQILSLQLQSSLGHISAKNAERLLIAYEPVWAIGTGKTATAEMAQATHHYIRTSMNKIGLHAAVIPILYGGSVKPDNIASLLACPDINGALVGGASLKAQDYSKLCSAQ